MTIVPRRLASALALGLPLAVFSLTGCHVDTHQSGDKNNVDIGTPFGSVHVKTNGAADAAATGMAVYPGAVPSTDHDGSNDNADVNMNFGGFHLGARVASFQSSDPRDQVLAFYRKDLARYGDVIECQGDHPVGQPTHTSLGLTCSDNGHHREIVTGDDLTLRSGSEQHQHIVALSSNDGGTKIGLVTLDLPSSLSGHGSKDVE